MKAITIKQPWAHLIVAGLKDIENRTWRTNFRGRVLVHAAGTPVKEGWSALDERQIKEVSVHKDKLYGESEELPQGCIVGSVEVVDCVQNHPSVWAEKGVWNWVLANPVMFDKPITGVKGKLSFWEYDRIQSNANAYECMHNDNEDEYDNENDKDKITPKGVRKNAGRCLPST